MSKETKTRDFRFELKEVTDEGTFEGLASVYGNVDTGNDVVEKGAFARTLNAHPEIPILWRHDQPIGKGSIEDSDKGLVVKGRLTLAVTQAREALALMKDGVVGGLSIGFRSIKDEVLNGVRRLKEVRLYEVSIVPFPMNELATITAVKEQPAMDEEKAGRTISSDTRSKLEAVLAAHRDAVEKLQALLDADKADADKSEPEPAEKSNDSLEEHSTLTQLDQILNEVKAWNQLNRN